MNPFVWFLVILAGIVALSLCITWLTFNWWLPYTKVETNGLRYRVMQLNRFRVWQEYDSRESLNSAEALAKERVAQWHEQHDSYRPIEPHERVAAKITYFNERK